MSVEFVAALVRQKASAAPPLLRRSAALAWHRRWWGMLLVEYLVAFAPTLANTAQSCSTRGCLCAPICRGAELSDFLWSLAAVAFFGILASVSEGSQDRHSSNSDMGEGFGP